jgi:tellurite methyltransferase
MEIEEYDLTEPSPFLAENIDLFPGGKALDIAMGGGRNAVFLAQQGFIVEGVDKSSKAIEAAMELARDKNVTIKAEVADLESGYLIHELSYDVIICFNYLQRSLMAQIKSGLKKGGMVVFETYIIDQLIFGRPTNPDHLLDRNELLKIFRDFRCLRYREGVIRGAKGPKAIASIVAQKE